MFDQTIEGLKNEIENLRHQLAIKTHNNLLNSIYYFLNRKSGCILLFNQ